MSIPESKGGAGPSTSASRQSSLSTGSYVPPHLRRAANTPTPSSSRHGFRDADATPSPTHPRARWSQTNSRSDPSPRDRPARLDLGSWSSPSPRGTPGSWASSPNDRDRFRSSPGLSSSGSSRNWSKYPPTSHLFISGDSFVGALSPALGPKEEEVDLRDPEQMEEMRIARRIKRVVIDKGKGAAAKGLNNPNSKKGQAPKVLSFGKDAFPDRHDYFRDPRFFMLMYGNVDLNINYLWQLRNRPLLPASFTPAELEGLHTPFEAFTNYVPPETDDDDVRAKHTDNDSRGHALGPKQFVAKVVREYTAFIEREIVLGPIGRMLQTLAEETRSVHWRGGGPSRSRVLVAGALPPMVLDPHLYRLQAKYVDQHADTPSRSPAPRAGADELSLSSLRLDDHDHAHAPAVGKQPHSASTRSSTSSRDCDRTVSPRLEEGLIDSTHSSLTSPSHSALSDEEKLEQLAKQTFESMLAQRPSICTLPTRVEMIDEFNDSLRAFCESHPDVLAYVSINEAMRAAHPDPDTGTGTGTDSEDDVKGTAVLKYYCSQAPGDGANVHPTWERTYPLWLDTLREAGVDVDSFPNVDLDKTEAQWTASKEERLLRSKYRT